MLAIKDAQDFLLKDLEDNNGQYSDLGHKVKNFIETLPNKDSHERTFSDDELIELLLSLEPEFFPEVFQPNEDQLLIDRTFTQKIGPLVFCLNAIVKSEDERVKCRENKIAIIKNLDDHDRLILSVILMAAAEVNLLTLDNFNWAMSLDSDPNRIRPVGMSIFWWFISGIKFEKEDFLKLRNHPSITMDHAGVISAIAISGFATKERFTHILDSPQASAISDFVGHLHHQARPPILTQANYQSIIDCIEVLDTYEIRHSCYFIPRLLLTQDFFNRLFNLARTGLNNHQIETARTEILNLIQEQTNAEIDEQIVGQDIAHQLNPQQSTHTASVHRSVSESAKKLHARYAQQLAQSGMEPILIQIHHWLVSLSNTFKNEVAKRAFMRIYSGRFDFKDPSSNISTKMLLALFWLAIHDNKKRIGLLNDAKNLLIEALYESQREYNLDINGIDNIDEADSQACAAGTFNKIISKLHGVDPDVIIIFMNLESASLKLKIVTRDAVVNYLASQASYSLQQNFQELLIKITGGIEFIWPEIKPEILKKITAEFSALHPDDNKRELFVDAAQSIEPQYILNYLQQHLFEQIQIIVDNKAMLAPKVKSGLFAGKASRDIRELQTILQKMKLRHCDFERGLIELISSSKKMGAKHPLTYLAENCWITYKLNQNHLIHRRVI